MEETIEYIPVRIPNPPGWMRRQMALKDPNHPHMIKLREAAARAHRLATEGKCDTLLAFLRSPSPDFDGSNEIIAKQLGISARTVIRLMNCLVKTGKIRIKRFTAKTPAGFRTQREITLLGEQN